MKKYFVLLFIIMLSATSCTIVRNTGSYSGGSNANNTDLTAGKVQREIKKGMSGAEVLQLLGSPNIVTKDENGLETWVYDRIATDASYSNQTDVLFLWIFAKRNNESDYQLSQSTFTVIIKMKDDKVDSFTYHSSKF
jgi:outer membrane protein assembly factor BamE (lipoprotein component of BamABCDE complex)